MSQTHGWLNFETTGDSAGSVASFCHPVELDIKTLALIINSERTLIAFLPDQCLGYLIFIRKEFWRHIFGKFAANSRQTIDRGYVQVLGDSVVVVVLISDGAGRRSCIAIRVQQDNTNMKLASRVAKAESRRRRHCG